MITPRKIFLCILVMGLAGSARAATYPGGLELEFSRTFPPDSQEVGIPAPVSVGFEMDEDVPLTDFYYSEQYPNWITVSAVQVTVNGLPVGYSYETGALDEVEPGTIPHRWIIGDPEQGGLPALQPGDELNIEYTITASQAGTLETHLDGWFGGLGDLVVFGDDYLSPEVLFGSDGVGVPPGAADGLVLERAYPNPFNPSTRIGFSLERPRSIQLDVVDGRGRLLRRLAADNFGAGHHSVVWDGLDQAGRELPSGLYFSRLSADGDVRLSGKLVLVK